MPIHKGSCLCQAVQYEATVPEGGPSMPTICHCQDCQKWSGSAFASNFILPAKDLKLTKGAEGAEIKVYTVINTTSGKALMKYFCDTCGSALYNKSEVDDKIVAIASGTLDDPIDATAQSMIEFFCVNRRTWLKPLDGAKQTQKLFE